METLNDLATGAFAMALVTSFFALARLALRSSAMPDALKIDGVCYAFAVVLTLAFAGATYLLGNGLAAMIDPYIAIILALTAQGSLVALAMRMTDAMSQPSADSRSSTAASA